MCRCRSENRWCHTRSEGDGLEEWEKLELEVGAELLEKRQLSKLLAQNVIDHLAVKLPGMAWQVKTAS